MREKETDEEKEEIKSKEKEGIEEGEWERERERQEEKGTGVEDVAARSYCRACCEDVIAFKEGGKVLLLREREKL